MTNALNKHKLDGIGLELLDILIVTTYYGLKEMLRKEQEEKRALQVAYSKLKEAYDELEAESGKGAKPIATAVKVRTLKFNFRQIG